MSKKILPWNSIHARLTLTTLVLFLVSLWSLSYITSQILKKDLQRLLSEQQFSTATMVATHLNDQIDIRLRALERYASTSAVAFLEGPAALQADLIRHSPLLELFNNSILFCQLDGTTLANSSSEEQRCDDSLTLAAINATLKDGKSTLSQFSQVDDKGDAVFAMVAPIHDASHQVIGALAGMISLKAPNFIDKFTEKTYGTTGGYLIIAPARRLIISATDKQRYMEILPAAGLNQEIDRFLNGYEGTQLMRNPHGVDMLASSAKVTKSGWILAVNLPVEEAFDPIRRIQRHMLIGTILLTLISGLLSRWFLKRQLAPLLNTVQTLDDIASNKQSRQTLQVTGEDEIGRLIGAFNHLLAALNEREMALQKNELFINAIINSVSAEIAVLDHEGVITMVNQSWIRFGEENKHISGKPASNTGVGNNYLAVCRANADSPAHADAVQALDGIEAVLNGKLHHFSMEYRCDSPAQQRWFNLIVTPLSHDMPGVVLSHNDITDRRQVEESLRLFRISMQDASEAIFWVTPDSHIVDVNLAACQLFGYSLQELLQMQVSDISLEQHASGEEWTAHFNELRQHGSMKFEAIHRTKQGKLIPCEVMASYINHSGEEFGCAFVRDISERKQSEAALLEAKAEAEKANNAKSRFLAAASHDLRQPLSALSLYVNLLEHHVSPDNSEIVNSIQHCVLSLSELLTDLLDISKLDAGVVNPHRSDFALDDLLTSLASVYAVESAAKNLQLRVRPSGIMLHSDQRLLRRIIGNLMSNAIRYTEKGGVLIACRRHQGKVWLEVWDTGMGIPEGKTKIIFEEFRQLGDEARNRGSGLGLSIVSKMAALLGLQIHVRSRLGTGSIFALELESAISDKNIASPGQHTRLSSSSDDLNLTSGNASLPPTLETENQVEKSLILPRIGVIDDNPQVLQALAFALENSGYKVFAAASGKQLIAQLANTAPDLILSDYRLAGGENGFEIIAAARAQFGADLPAIIMTGDTDPSMIRSMGSHGVIILYKPVPFDALKAIVNEAIRTGRT